MLNEWRAISIRVQALRDAATLYATLNARAQDSHGSIKVLVQQCFALFDEIRSYSDQFSDALPLRVHNSLSVFVNKHKSLFKPDGLSSGDMYSARLIGTLILLLALDVEVTHLITDVQSVIRRRSERAFAHLQRSIVADDEIRQKWARAFNSGETACEKLGAAHLLQHGIWAFKANPGRAQTDLIFGEPITDAREVERAADGLVLTEWKRAKSTSDAAAMFDQARAQAANYAGNSMVGIELANYRYLVVVTKEPIATVAEIPEGAIIYRCVNIAIDVPTPSKASRKITKK